MRKLVSVLALSVLLHPLAAFAAPAVSELGVADVKKTVDSALAYYLQMAKSSNQGFGLSGDPQITPKKDFYEIRLPGATLTQDGEKINIGTIVINAVPGDHGEYLASIALPSTMTLAEADGKSAMTLKIGAQKFSGAWQPLLNSFTKIDADYKNLTLSGTGGEHPFSLTLGELKSQMNLEQGSDKTWSGPVFAELSNIMLSYPGLGGTSAADTSLENFKLKVTYDHIDLQAMSDMKLKTLALFKDGRQPQPAELKQVMEGMLTDPSSGGLMNGLTSGFSATNLTISVKPDAAHAATQKPVLVKVANADNLLTVNNILADKGDFSLKFHMNGLSMANLSPDTAALMPTTSSFEIYGDSLPMKDLRATFAQLFTDALDTAISQKTAQGGDNAEAISAGADKQKFQTDTAKFVNGLPALMAKSGAALSIRNTHLDAPELTTTAEAQLKGQDGAAPETRAHFLGTLTIAFKGLDELLQKSAATPPTDPQIVQIEQFLTMAQMMGKQDKAPDGKSLRIYKLDLTPEGKILMNGADLSAMSGAMGVKMPQAAPAK